MGIERATVSTKLSPENVEFLDDWGRRLRPYEISQSSLLNLCVRIVRHLHAVGELHLEPKELQALFATERGDILAELSSRRTLQKH